jgi:hypothetical protein
MGESLMVGKEPAGRLDCSWPPSPEFLVGVRQFNEGEYFACHETLEELWFAERGAMRRLYQGVLQVGVGLYHLQRGNEKGSLILLAKGKELLCPFAPMCLGIDVERLVCDAEEVLRTLQTLGLQRTQALSPELFPRIRLIGEEEETGGRSRGAASG